ncbi:hypothetical protein F4775DRAFT_603412 [Biscogniauxia sp. FL1348]|nr:hypothetical protein F4775DRAFT_603412 [Biscogniauxia sp. FL1348]
MEPQRLPKRSASHGTLRGSYSAHGRSGLGPSPMRPLHKPLRSVNENSVLLPSPGALESMLKTTTETGDIGIFSIKPVPLSPQRRDAFSDLGQLHPPPRRSVDDLYRRGIARKPPCNRDTTSEIVSMYGTESQKSGTSTLSPASTEYLGPRSYSMTTCGSKHLSHHKSTATLQSQGSSSQLQRPRSPFPYPTRLKRPGVRPSSPALTENGRVDYSRMVEIDRISYRTIHSPYKPTYPSVPRRPPPLGLRADGNQSTPSLLHPGPPPNYHGPPPPPPPPPSIRTHSAASMNSWNTPRRERIDSVSTRTSSLTSIVNMYHRVPRTLQASANELSVPAPRYYDYTEDFEGKQPRAITPNQPLAPIPTRASDSQRPLVLQESDDHLAAVFDEGDPAFLGNESQSTVGTDVLRVSRNLTPRPENTVHASGSPSLHCRPQSGCAQDMGMGLNESEVKRKITRGSDIDLLPSQVLRDSIDTFNPSLDLESKDVPAYDYTNYRVTVTPRTKTNSPERRVQVLGGRAPTIRSEQGVILRDDVQDEFSGKEVADEHKKAQSNEETVVLKSSRGITQRRSFSEPSRETALPPTLYERKSATSGMDGGQDHMYLVPLGKNELQEQEDDQEKNIKSCPPSHAPVSMEKNQFRRHRRNQAVLRISTTSLPREDNEGFPHITPSCSATPLISPKPISPARQLKVKNSIPQLMKALPPLPGDLNYIAPPTPNTTGEEDSFAELLSPFNLSPPSPPRLYNNRDATKSETSLTHDRTPSLQKNPPKARLKLKTSNSPGARSSTDFKPWSSDNNNYDSRQIPHSEIEGNGSIEDFRVRTRSRLKLRSSKSTGIQTPPEATVRRNPDAVSSEVIADLARHPPRDLFTNTSTGLGPATQVNRSPPQIPLENSPGISSIPSTAFLGNANGLSGRRLSISSSTHTSKGSQTKCSTPTKDSRIGRAYGLKKNLSHVRALLARSSDSSFHFTQVPGADTNVAYQKFPNLLGGYRGVSSTNLSSKHFISTDRRSTAGSTHTPFRLRIRTKLSSWVKGAKSAVRRCKHKKRGTWNEKQGHV